MGPVGAFTGDTVVGDMDDELGRRVGGLGGDVVAPRGG